MSDQQQRGGFAQHAPAWIASITAVLALAVTVVVILAIRSGSEQAGGPSGGADGGTSASVASDDVTPTDPTTSPTTSPTEPATSAVPVTVPAVFWSGPLRFRDSISPDAGFSFDVTPPRYIEDHSIALFDRGLSGNDGILLAEWTSNGVPTWTQCSDQVTNEGTDSTGALSDGSVLCGRTLEGRIFRIQVNHFDDADFNSTVTVWAP